MPVIGVPRETATGETRVALVPANVVHLIRDKHTVLVQSGAGEAAGFADVDYRTAGAKVVSIVALYKSANLIVKVQPPSSSEVLKLRPRTTFIGFLAPPAKASPV